MTKSEQWGFFHINNWEYVSKPCSIQCETGILTGRTDPFDGRGWVSRHCAVELCRLALLDIQH